MKKTIALIFALCLTSHAFALSPLGQNEAAKVEQAIEAETAKTNTLKTSFKQVKHIGGMSRDLVSNGEMMIKKENKVIMSYTTPIAYRMVLNGNKVMMETGGKKNVFNANGGGKAMNDMQTMMNACMSGNLKALKKDYKLGYFDNGSTYLVKIVPLAKQAAFKEIEMELLKTDKQLTRLRLTEKAKAGKTENDFTEFLFSNTLQNIDLPDEMFAIN